MVRRIEDALDERKAERRRGQPEPGHSPERRATPRGRRAGDRKPPEGAA